jgi:glycosyltransferase involved in cell wall biosynthesis
MVAVLTSRYQRERATAEEAHIHRLLHLDGDLFYYQPRHFFTQWLKQQRENRETVRQVMASFKPDLVFVWGMWAMSRAVPATVEALLPDGVVYYLSDYWPSAADMHSTYWEAPARHRLMQGPKWLLRQIARRIQARAQHPPLRFKNAICVSHAVRRHLIAAGLPLQGAQVIHGGTDLGRFQREVKRLYQNQDGTLRLLYAGQLVEHKGVHTAVEAMAHLAQNRPAREVQLTVMGAGHPAYEAGLRRMVDDAGLHDYVHFRAPVAAREMPAVLDEHDVLIFPSIYEEPLARMTQEAMASGIVVIGTLTGGTPEILEDGENGLTFPAADAGRLASQIERLLEEPELAAQLAAAGRQSIVDYFNLQRMVDDIEAYLQAVVDGETGQRDSMLLEEPV